MRRKIVRLVLTFLGLHSLVEGLDLHQYPEYDDDIDTDVRIFNGQKANVRNFAFVVKLDTLDGGLCSGSVIADEWIITAGHCLEGEQCSSITIIPAAWPAGEFVNPINCIVHPEFSRYITAGVDLGLIKVPILRLRHPTGKINLPRKASIVATNSWANVAGYGAMGNGPVSQQLMQTRVQVENWKECNRRYQKRELDTNPNWKLVNIPITYFCTVGRGSAPGAHCVGDSGGPVVIDGVLKGIVSFIQNEGFRCGTGLPSYHVGLVHYLTWIYSYIAP